MITTLTHHVDRLAMGAIEGRLPPMPPVGMAIRHWRKAKGLTAKDTAKLFGCSRIQLFRLEAGTRAITADMALVIEAKTERDIPRSALRPDLWPEPVAA